MFVEESKMLKYILYANIVSIIQIVVDCGDIGPGIWHVTYVDKCEVADHKFKFDIAQKKINRTHDGFDFSMNLSEPFTEEFAVRVEVCKYVDGGCKPYQVISEDSCVKFIDKYAKNNKKYALELAGVDPPDFPVGEGEYEVNEYIFDYSELPAEGPYGEYTAIGVIQRGTEEMGCLEIGVEFVESDEEEDD